MPSGQFSRIGRSGNQAPDLLRWRPEKVPLHYHYNKTLLEQETLRSGRYSEYVCLFQMAGLLHDVGHGPFSHLFDDCFIQEITTTTRATEEWSHELQSCKIFGMHE